MCSNGFGCAKNAPMLIELIVALVLLLRNGENSRKILVWKKICENVPVLTMQLQVAP